MQDTIQSLVTEFWTGLGITLEKVETVVTAEDVNIHIQTPDSALIIGMHGKSIGAFQHILARMIERVTGNFARVHLEVNDYMRSKDDRLFKLLESKIQYLMTHGGKTTLSSLSAYDRKKAHDYIAQKNIIGMRSYSEWAGAERVLILENTSPVIKNQSAPAVVCDISEEGTGI